MKSTIAEIRRRFDADVERFSNLETERSATVDALPVMPPVLLLGGAARLPVEGEELIDLRPGELANIPGHRRQRAERTDPTQPTIWPAERHGGRD